MVFFLDMYGVRPFVADIRRVAVKKGPRAVISFDEVGIGEGLNTYPLEATSNFLKMPFECFRAPPVFSVRVSPEISHPCSEGGLEQIIKPHGPLDISQGICCLPLEDLKESAGDQDLFRLASVISLLAPWPFL